METESQTEGLLINPQEDVFIDIVARTTGKRILDVGSGGRLSVSLRSGDLYVMVDPMMGPGGSIISGENRREQGSKTVCFSSDIQDVPRFRSDLVMMVAPNPVDIIDGDLLDQLLPYFRMSKNVLFVLDTGTIEATINPVTLRPDNSGLSMAKQKISSILRQNGYDVEIRRGTGDSIGSILSEMNINRRGVLNSGDLGAEKVLITATR